MSSALQICPFAAVPPAGRVAVWEVTSACNLRCSHCLARAGDRDDVELDQKMVLSALRALDVVEVVISGGEPLLHPQTIARIHALRQMGMTAMLYTNGILVTPEITQALREAGLSYALVSLDGATPETHERLRTGRPSFKAACDASRLFRAAGIEVCIAMSVGKHNAHEAGRVVELADSLGAIELTVTPMMPLGRGAKDENILLLDSAMRQQIATDLCTMAEEHPALSVERIRLPIPGEEHDIEARCRYASVVMLKADGVVGTCPWMATMEVGTVDSRNSHIDASYVKACEVVEGMLRGRAENAGCPLASVLHGEGVLDRDPLVGSSEVI